MAWALAAVLWMVAVALWFLTALIGGDAVRSRDRVAKLAAGTTWILGVFFAASGFVLVLA